MLFFKNWINYSFLSLFYKISYHFQCISRIPEYSIHFIFWTYPPIVKTSSSVRFSLSKKKPKRQSKQRVSMRASCSLRFLTIILPLPRFLSLSHRLSPMMLFSLSDLKKWICMSRIWVAPIWKKIVFTSSVLLSCLRPGSRSSLFFYFWFFLTFFIWTGEIFVFQVDILHSPL